MTSRSSKGRGTIIITVIPMIIRTIMVTPMTIRTITVIPMTIPTITTIPMIMGIITTMTTRTIITIMIIPIPTTCITGGAKPG